MRAWVCAGLLVCLLFLRGGIAGQNSSRSTRSPHGNLNINCENCHTFTAWKPLRNIVEFDHSKTRYPLRGQHAAVSCTQCHVSLVFTNVGAKCADCHADIHRGQFGAKCEDCHSVKGWRSSIKSVGGHDNRFPLVGAHATLLCDDCHKGAGTSQFTGLSTQCVSCHLQDYAKTTLPNHQVAKFSTACEQCHSMDGWFGAKFDHAKFTGFALTGMHATLECSACHGSNFQVAGGTCVNCHLNDYNATTNPNHAQAGFSQQCTTCHNTASWSQVTFNHNTFTKFPLTGAHANVACQQCHVNGQFAGTPTDCYSCHAKDFNSTANPNHVQAGFPQQCELCHSTTSWSGAHFDHSKTPFPLTGAHTTVACALCHVNNNFTSLGTTCVSCHLTDFQKTNNPPHQQAGFPQQCDLCHSTTSWAGATFDHNTFAKFPLTGAHATLACGQCHVNNNFNLTSTACNSCHLNDYNGTTNPSHAAAGFPTDCSICHTTASWSGAQFDHSKEGFPLTGAHATLNSCLLCHINNNFALQTTACVSCHLRDYNGTTNPSHVQAAFPQQCDVCHSTTAWTPASFNHNNTPFPLTGAHVNTPCNSCHINGQFAGTPTDCYSCHQAQYKSTTDPNHVAAGFPTTCQTCHNTTSWLGATFNHTWWPTNHGGANGVCSTCHTNPNDYSVFVCTNCHTKAQTDSNHQGVNGYVYNSINCYQCHKNGGGGGG